MKWITILFAVLMSMTLVSGSYYSADITGTNRTNYWALDEESGTNTFDNSAQENNGTLVNTPLWVSGIIGNGLKFDGADQTVDISAITFTNGSNHSVCLWVKYARKPTGFIIPFGHTDTSSSSIYMGDSGGSRFRYRSTSGDTGLNVALTESLNWQQVCWVIDGTQGTLYVNGVFKYTQVMVTTGMIYNSWGSGYSGDSYTWNGSIDEIMVFNKSSLVSQIKELYSCRTPNNGTGTWTMLANCTVSNETDTFNQTFIATAGKYIADNTTLIIPKAIAEGGKLVATNGGKIIAGT